MTQALLGWSSGHYLSPDGPTALDHYLEERGGALAAEGRARVEAQRTAWFSYHEVVSAEQGRTITLRDLVAGGEGAVEEKSASRMVRPRDVLLARVLDLGSRAILGGCHLRSLPPREGHEARRRLRSTLRVRAAKVPAAKLLEATADGTLFPTWQVIVGAADAPPPPRLQNTDGEDLILPVDRFDTPRGRRTRSSPVSWTGPTRSETKKTATEPSPSRLSERGMPRRAADHAHRSRDSRRRSPPP